MTDTEQTEKRDDHELILEVQTDVGDTVRVWRVTFQDPNPVRLEVRDDDGDHAEAWLSDAESRALGRALEVIE